MEEETDYRDQPTSEDNNNASSYAIARANQLQTIAAPMAVSDFEQ